MVKHKFSQLAERVSLGYMAFTPRCPAFVRENHKRPRTGQSRTSHFRPVVSACTFCSEAKVQKTKELDEDGGTVGEDEEGGDDGGEGPSGAKKAKTEETPLEKIVRELENFSEFKLALQVDWRTKDTINLGPRLPEAYWIFRTVWIFEERYGPLPAEVDSDNLLILDDIWVELLKAAGMKPAALKTSPQKFAQHLAGSLAPVASVIGGVCGQVSQPHTFRPDLHAHPLFPTPRRYSRPSARRIVPSTTSSSTTDTTAPGWSPRSLPYLATFVSLLRTATDSFLLSPRLVSFLGFIASPCEGSSSLRFRLDQAMTAHQAFEILFFRLASISPLRHSSS